MDKILEFFIKEPEREFHIREIARKLKKSPTTISKYLRGHEKKGFLKSEKKLNHLFFKANSGNRAFKHLKLYYNLTLLHNSGLVDYLVKEFNQPEALVLFGSFAKAENFVKSDIDLFIISPLKKELNLQEYEKKLGYKIQLFVKSRLEIERMKEKNPELLNNWINGFVVYGFWEIFR